MSYGNSPLTRSAAAVLPLVIAAMDELNGLAAPQASRIATRIGLVLTDLIEVADEIEGYGNKWCGGEIGQLAEKIRSATAEYNGV